MPLYTLGYVAKKAPPSLGSFPLARSIVMSTRIGCQSDAKVNQMTQYIGEKREKKKETSATVDMNVHIAFIGLIVANSKWISNDPHSHVQSICCE